MGSYPSTFKNIVALSQMKMGSLPFKMIVPNSQVKMGSIIGFFNTMVSRARVNKMGSLAALSGGCAIGVSGMLIREGILEDRKRKEDEARTLAAIRTFQEDYTGSPTGSDSGVLPGMKIVQLTCGPFCKTNCEDPSN